MQLVHGITLQLTGHLQLTHGVTNYRTQDQPSRHALRNGQFLQCCRNAPRLNRWTFRCAMLAAVVVLLPAYSAVVLRCM